MQFTIQFKTPFITQCLAGQKIKRVNGSTEWIFHTEGYIVSYECFFLFIRVGYKFMRFLLSTRDCDGEVLTRCHRFITSLHVILDQVSQSA